MFTLTLLFWFEPKTGSDGRDGSRILRCHYHVYSKIKSAAIAKRIPCVHCNTLRTSSLNSIIKAHQGDGSWLSLGVDRRLNSANLGS